MKSAEEPDEQNFWEEQSGRLVAQKQKSAAQLERREGRRDGRTDGTATGFTGPEPTWPDRDIYPEVRIQTLDPEAACGVSYSMAEQTLRIRLRRPLPQGEALHTYYQLKQNSLDNPARKREDGEGVLV